MSLLIKVICSVVFFLIAHSVIIFKLCFFPSYKDRNYVFYGGLRVEIGNVLWKTLRFVVFPVKIRCRIEICGQDRGLSG